jgi:prolyl-tRNA editing enzyme YbaK/EbsC (Cys-tRNA(Pro) deacylase)
MSTPDGTPAPGARLGSAARVRACLESHGLAEEIVHFEESTKTAQMAADAMGCELGQIVKSLVFVVDETPVVALVAGDRRGDAGAIAHEAGGTSAHFADAETVRAATGYAIGGVSPFDLPDGLLVLIDESLQRYEIVYPAAGTPSSMVRMTFGQLLAVTGGRIAPVGR